MSGAGSEVMGHWLARCEGFRVNGPEGRIGVVEEVLRVGPDEADSLIVRGGLFANRLFVIPAADAEQVLPRKQLVVVGSPARVHGDFLGDLLARLRSFQSGTGARSLRA